MKTVVMVGHNVYDGPTEDVEVWGCNWSFKRQHVDRLYFADPIDELGDGFAERVTALGVPVYAQRAYEEIPKCLSLPVYDIIAECGDVNYFTSTPSYMLAHAIYEGVPRVVLHGMYVEAMHPEYKDQKACLEYWIGYARGTGMEVEVSGGSLLGVPYPWQSRMYGYMKRTGNQQLMEKVAALAAMPIKESNG